MKKLTGQHRSHRGFALIELLIVILVLGVVAAMLYPAVADSRGHGFDLVKKNNEKLLNADLLTLYVAGVDTTQYWNAPAAIAALKTGISVPVAGGQVQVVKIDFDVNPAAYTFMPATATAPAVFTALLGHRDVRP
jgi:prepilin-type N-terminal cleavage/methylation domain-containing protein